MGIIKGILQALMSYKWTFIIGGMLLAGLGAFLKLKGYESSTNIMIAALVQEALGFGLLLFELWLRQPVKRNS